MSSFHHQSFLDLSFLHRKKTSSFCQFVSTLAVFSHFSGKSHSPLPEPFTAAASTLFSTHPFHRLILWSCPKYLLLPCQKCQQRNICNKVRGQSVKGSAVQSTLKYTDKLKMLICTRQNNSLSPQYQSNKTSTWFSQNSDFKQSFGLRPLPLDLQQQLL